MKKWLARRKGDQVNPKNQNHQSLQKNLKHQRNRKKRGNTTVKRKQNQEQCVKMTLKRLRCQLTACFLLLINMKSPRMETLIMNMTLNQLLSLLILMKRSKRNLLSS